MATNGSNLTMPPTDTPGEIPSILIGLTVGGFGLLYILLGFLDWTWNPIWSLIVVLVTLGVTIERYTETVPGYFGRILLNHLSGKQRTIFQGLHLKLPWESVTRDVDLRVDLKGVHEETYASMDAKMETKYVYTMRPTLNGESVILYSTYETDALKQSLRSLLSMLLSDYYGRHTGEQLLDKLRINQEVFEGKEVRPVDPLNPLPPDYKTGKELIEDFQKSYGVEIMARLEDSDFDAATQAARDTKSRAKSLREAAHELMVEGGPDGKGMSREDAEKRAAQLQDLVHENLITIKAEGIPEGTNIAMVPMPTGFLGGDKGGKGGGKKK